MGQEVVRVERSVEIAASQREVFEYVADYGNVLTFMHKVRRFEPRGERNHGLGARFYWETAVKGLRIGWEFVVAEFIPHEWMAAKTTRGPRSTCSWRFMPVEGGTLATLRIALELPRGLVLGPIGRRLVEREIAAGMERSLANLGARLGVPGARRRIA